MFFVDSALAYRLEMTSAWRAIEYARAVERLRPGAGAAVEPVAGGYAVYTGPAFPVNRAYGLGLEGPVHPSALGAVERFYRHRGAVPRVSVCPLADPSWLELLRTSDYGLEGFESMLVRSLTLDAADPATIPDVDVSVADSKDRDLWLRTVAQGFDGMEDPSQATWNILAANFDSAQATCYLARVDGEPAGGGELFIHQGAAEFGSASTRPAFRRRGVQAALLAARLAAARAAGCDLALVLTEPGSDSQRNVERAGFRLAYTQVLLAANRQSMR